MAVYVERERSDFWQLYKEPGEDRYLDPLGPRNCMTHSAARMVMRVCEGVKPAITPDYAWPPTGEVIRRFCLNADGTRDVIGGVHHGQVRVAVKRLYGIDLTLLYGDPFDEIIDALEATRPVMVSLWYRRIRDYIPRRGSLTFYQNHELFLSSVDRARGVFRNVVEPLANGGDYGRPAGLYHGPGEYSIGLIRACAGELNVSVDPNGYRALGAGRVYAAIGPATGAAPAVVRKQLYLTPGSFWVYESDGRPFEDSRGVEYGGTISSRFARSVSRATSAPCTAPAWHRWPGMPSRRLVKVTDGFLKGLYVATPQSHVEVRSV